MHLQVVTHAAGTNSLPPEQILLTVGSIIVALLSAAFAASTFYAGRTRDKRDLFLKIHERLLDLDIQEGRSLLRNASPLTVCRFAAMKADELESADYAKINRSVAMLDVMGLYVDMNYISRRLVLDEWAVVLREIAPAARVFTDFRARESSNPDIWPHLRGLLSAAQDPVLSPARGPVRPKWLSRTAVILAAAVGTAALLVNFVIPRLVAVPEAHAIGVSNILAVLATLAAAAALTVHADWKRVRTEEGLWRIFLVLSLASLALFVGGSSLYLARS